MIQEKDAKLPINYVSQTCGPRHKKTQTITQSLVFWYYGTFTILRHGPRIFFCQNVALV